jgi:hypothetical protein
MPRRQTKSKTKKQHWFTRIRGSYLPNSWQAWLLYVPFTAFLILTGLHAAKGNPSVGEFVLGIFPQWVAAAVVMTWIAARTS